MLQEQLRMNELRTPDPELELVGGDEGCGCMKYTR